MKKKTLRNRALCQVTVALTNNLAKHKKRIVTIASLFGFLFNERCQDKGLEERLSKIMNLAERPCALSLPLIHNKWIWDPIVDQCDMNDINEARVLIVKEKKISMKDALRYAEMVILILPAYLLYDCIDTVKKDLAHLFESIPFILGHSGGQTA